MSQSIEEAIRVVKTTSDEEQYRIACEYLIQNRGQLTHRVFINLPGGLSGNQDLRWEHVKKNSVERCGCGNERVILPENPRTEFEVSDKDKIVVSSGNDVYLRPIGGDKASAYMKLWIEVGGTPGLAFMSDPFAPLVFSLDIFSTKGYPLQQLADVPPEQTEPPVMVHGKEKIPLFAINEVDVSAKTVTITLDKGVEAFNPDVVPEGHDCRVSS